MKGKKSIAIIIGFVFMMSLENCVNKKEKLHKLLESIVASANKQCPIMIDNENRMDSLKISSDNEFQYFYSSINSFKEDIDTIRFKNEIIKASINDLRTNPGMKLEIDNNVTFSHTYMDKNGKYVFKAVITPEMYKK
jgi:hypothetical protein